MAAYTDIISIIGGAASNSYVSGAETDSFCCSAVLGRCLASKVRIRTDHRHRLSLQLVRNRRLGGHALHTIDDDDGVPQALSWPRSGASCDGVAASCTMIPNDVKRAQMLLAYQLVVNPDAITGTPGGGGGSSCWDLRQQAAAG